MEYKSEKNRFGPWLKPTRPPVHQTILTAAKKIVIMYNFNNEQRRQKEAESIGLDLTEELIKMFMMWWDEEMLKEL